MSIFNPSKRNDELWTPTLEFYTTYKADALKPIVKRIAKVALKACTADSNCPMQTVVDKYAQAHFKSVSTSEEMAGDKIQELAKN
jgi:hypothetical protein